MKKFDFNTIEDFDEHIKKSIPNYDILINAIQSISEYFISKDAIIYDLGCSTGALLKSIHFDNRKIGYDNAAILPKDQSDIEFKTIDLNSDFEIKNACIVYSIFTMQFLNKPSRENFCKTIYNGLNVGAALILCEKIYQENGVMQEILSFSHYDYKCLYFSEEEIIKKERDLRYIMKPSTLKQNIDILKEVGFETITTFWQSYNFIALIAIK